MGFGGGKKGKGKGIVDGESSGIVDTSLAVLVDTKESDGDEFFGTGKNWFESTGFILVCVLMGLSLLVMAALFARRQLQKLKEDIDDLSNKKKKGDKKEGESSSTKSYDETNHFLNQEVVPTTPDPNLSTIINIEKPGESLLSFQGPPSAVKRLITSDLLKWQVEYNAFIEDNQNSSKNFGLGELLANKGLNVERLVNWRDRHLITVQEYEYLKNEVTEELVQRELLLIEREEMDANATIAPGMITTAAPIASKGGILFGITPSNKNKKKLNTPKDKLKTPKNNNMLNTSSNIGKIKSKKSPRGIPTKNSSANNSSSSSSSSSSDSEDASKKKLDPKKLDYYHLAGVKSPSKSPAGVKSTATGATGSTLKVAVIVMGTVMFCIEKFILAFKKC